MSSTRAAVESGLVAGGVPAELAREILDSFEDAKRRFYLGDYRPQAIDGGRFSEGVGRVVELATSGTYTSLGSNTFKMDAVIKQAESSVGASDAMRLHIPRTLRLIYDIRNRRNAAHLRDNISPNVQDATLIVSTMGWLLGELVREYHQISAAEAQDLIEKLVSRDVPMIQELDGFPRLLATLPARTHCLVLLYWAGSRVSRSKLEAWLPEPMRKNLTRTLRGLHDKHLVHVDDAGVVITHLGERKVEQDGLIAPL